MKWGTAVGALVFVVSSSGAALGCSFIRSTHVFFDSGSAVLKQDALSGLTGFIDTFIPTRNGRCVELRIEAHVDGDEARSRPTGLDRARLEAVVEALKRQVADPDIAGRRARGFEAPLVQTSDPEPQNRRVEVRWDRPEGGRSACDPPQDPPSPCGRRCKYILADGTDCGY